MDQLVYLLLLSLPAKGPHRSFEIFNADDKAMLDRGVSLEVEALVHEEFRLSQCSSLGINARHFRITNEHTPWYISALLVGNTRARQVHAAS